MIVFTVHEPPDPPADRLDRAESLVFVRDGFSWSAMLFAPLWMALNGLWLVLAVYLAAIGALLVFLAAIGVHSQWIALVIVALHVVLGYEATSLRRWTLGRRGWRFISSVTGRTAADCERRFFEAWLPGEPFLDRGRPTAPTPPMGAPRSPRPTRSWWFFRSREWL